MKNPIKNQGGSALAYVLIFSVIIMVLVVGLLTVAQSGISFTQQTVESRQAYIDAKSVIEYGKIEINARKEWLETNNVKRAELEVLYDQREAAEAENKSTTSIQNQIEVMIAEINTYMMTDFYVGGTAGNIASTVSEMTYDKTQAGEEQNVRESALGVMTITDTGFWDDAKEWVFNYDFDIKTQNLRRPLNYQVSLYDYSGSGDDPAEPISLEWLNTSINRIHYQDMKCTIQKEGVIKEMDTATKTLTIDESALSLNVGAKNNKFEWSQQCTLNMKAKNICFTAPFPTDSVYQSLFNIEAVNNIWVMQDYVQSNNDTSIINNFTAGNDIVFEGDLTLNYAANLKIQCENLWIKGNVNLGTKASLEIDADNVYILGDTTVGDQSQINLTCKENILIQGTLNLLTNSAKPVNYLKAESILIGTEENPVNMTVQNATRVIWNCESFELYGDMTTTSSSSYQEFNNINYFQAGKINLSDKCTLKIDGKDGSKNQVIIDSIIPLESNAYTLEIKDLELFKCNGNLGLTDNSTMDLKADNILIGGNVLFSFTNDIKIETDYLDVLGSTTINRIYKEVLIEGISNLNVRFAGGYDQTNSIVTIKNADKTIFGGSEKSFRFGGDGKDAAKLNLNSDMIYIDADTIDFKQYYWDETVIFKYNGKNGLNCDLNLKKNIDWNPGGVADGIISTGKYTLVSGDFPSGKGGRMLYELTPDVSYDAPSWTNLNITPNSPTVITVPDAPIYDGIVRGGGGLNGSDGLEKYY